jgi:PAS domain S-box-containing protein
MEEAVAFGRSLNLAFRTQRPGGAIGWIEAHAKPSVTELAGQRHVVGVMKDITARREAEERLRQAAAVFQTTAEGIFLMDREHRLVSVNPAFSAITGYRPDEVLGHDPEVLLHARRHSDQFYRRLETNPGGHWQGETYCRHKNGTVFPAWENVSVVRDEGGAVGHYVVAFSDISAMRRAEAQLNHLAHHDPLTGLPNRPLFNDRLDLTLARAQREEGRCAILFFDLDGFKSSTTPSAIRAAMCCSRPSPPGSSEACEATTPRPGSGAMSSLFYSITSANPRTRRASRASSSRPWPCLWSSGRSQLASPRVWASVSIPITAAAAMRCSRLPIPPCTAGATATVSIIPRIWRRAPPSA